MLLEIRGCRKLDAWLEQVERSRNLEKAATERASGGVPAELFLEIF